MAHDLPPHFGTSFTPTIHAAIPPNINPTAVTLPHPFVVVVTGAGKGLGFHISLAYAKAGCSGLCISSRTPSDLEALEHAIHQIDAKISVLKTVCDVQSGQSVLDLEAQVRRKWGRVDVVVANAGIISQYVDDAQGKSNLPIGIIRDGDWARVMDINLMGTWRISNVVPFVWLDRTVSFANEGWEYAGKAFMPLLVETTDGPQTLICCTSMAGHSYKSDLTPIAYNVSKIACNRLIEHVANDHGKEGVCA
jgi:NAD(P)-dependent dehydrogenase (short-subunit alcohol dehydrogenase family)